MDSGNKKPVLIVIAGPNGSGKVLRFSDGKIAKRYTEELPEWAKQIIQEQTKDN